MQEQVVSGGCNTPTQLVQTSERLMQFYDCIDNCEVAAIVSCIDSVAESVTKLFIGIGCSCRNWWQNVVSYLCCCVIWSNL